MRACQYITPEKKFLMLLSKDKKVGVYAIRCTVNGRMYIGESLDIDQRWRRHIEDLSSGCHHSKKLQEDWDLYGEHKFKFDIIELLDEEYSSKYIKAVPILLQRERAIQKRYGTIKNGYNSVDTVKQILEGRDNGAHQVKPEVMRYYVDNHICEDCPPKGSGVNANFESR